MFQKAKSPKNKGFTLIELLVVISIISLLSTIVLASLNTSREKAKVAEFVSNVKQFQLALELYKNQTGLYPHEGTDYYLNATPSNFYAYIDYVTQTEYVSFDEYFTSVTDPAFIPTFMPGFFNIPEEFATFAYITPKNDGNADPYTTVHDANCGGVLLRDVNYYIYILSFNISLPYPIVYYGATPQPGRYCITSS